MLERNGLSYGSAGLIAALYLTGMVAWGYFFNWGSIPYEFHDWAEVNMPRLAVVQDGLQKNVLPVHVAKPAILRCGAGCDRYLSSVDTLASPDLILLKWLPPGAWVLAHMLLLYSIGFLGLLDLRRRFGFSLPVFIFVTLLFNFNGHLLAHLAVGHITWGGTFLLPWLAVLVDRFIAGDDSWAWVMQVALLLFGTLLQGAFHQFVWATIFLGFLGLAYLRRFFTVCKALVFTSLVSAVRILPPLLAFRNFDRDFFGGYPDLFSVYAALTHWVAPGEAMPFEHFGSRLGFWEFDLFIGKAGFYCLLVMGGLWLALQVRTRSFDRILIPIGAVFLLSLDEVSGLIHRMQIPLYAGERVTTRIISMAFIFYVLYASSALQKIINRLGRWKPAALAAAVPLLGYLGFVLFEKFLAWRVTETFKAFPYTPAILDGYLVANHADPFYLLVLTAGGLVSAVSTGILAWKAFRQGGFPGKRVTRT